MYSYKHHVIPFHEWKRRINPEATRRNKDFNAPDNVVWLTLEQHTQVHCRMAEDGSKFDQVAYLRMSKQIGHEEASKLANSVAHKNNTYAGRYVRTEEWRQAQSIRKTGNHYAKGNNTFRHTEEFKRSQAIRMKNNQHAAKKEKTNSHI